MREPQPHRGQFPNLTIDFMPVCFGSDVFNRLKVKFPIKLSILPRIFGVKVGADSLDALGRMKVFELSDLLGVRIDAKKGDLLGNLEVFALGVGGGWLREEKCI